MVANCPNLLGPCLAILNPFMDTSLIMHQSLPGKYSKTKTRKLSFWTRFFTKTIGIKPNAYKRKFMIAANEPQTVKTATTNENKVSILASLCKLNLDNSIISLRGQLTFFTRMLQIRLKTYQISHSIAKTINHLIYALTLSQNRYTELLA